MITDDVIPLFDDHFPDCVPLHDGTRGHFCKQCSEAVQEYVNWPCVAFVDGVRDIERNGAAEGWDAGEASGWSRAMRHMSDEPTVQRATNPYRSG